MNEQDLIGRLAAMPRERSPARDLWPELSAAIAGQPRHQRLPAPRRQRWVPLAMAASTALALVLLWPHRDAPTGLPLARVEPPPSYQAIERQADALSIEYRVALAQLASAPMPEALRPAARELRNSEQSLREALRQNPESTFLLAQLRRTYEQQLRLSQRAAFG